MSSVREIAVQPSGVILPGADWADCWQAEPVGEFSTARQAANAVMRALPKWMLPLLVLRQILVAPFGLLGKKDIDPEADTIGFFPVADEGPNRIIAGIDDRHLDFRIIVDLDDAASGQSLALTTVIKRHNRLGRTYLALILPFHRAIIKSALRKLVI